MTDMGGVQTNGVRGLPPGDAATWLATFIGAFKVDYATEKAAQHDICCALLLQKALLGEVSREHRLDARDIPDFLVDERIVVEVKARRARAPEALVVGPYQAQAVELLVINRTGSGSWWATRSGSARPTSPPGLPDPRRAAGGDRLPRAPAAAVGATWSSASPR
jgi:hypothetical protein